MTEPTSTDLAPIVVRQAVASIDTVLKRLANTDTAGEAVTPAAPNADRNLLITKVDELEAYTGVALAAPVRAAAHTVVAAWAVDAGELRTLRLHHSQLSYDAAALEQVLDTARGALVAVGEAYVTRDRAAIEAEFLNSELEELVKVAAQAGSLDPAQASARISEARKRAARKAAELVAEELAANSPARPA